MILVTGGTGFVGRQVVSALYDRGNSLRLVVREGSNHDLELVGHHEIIKTHNLFLESQEWFAQVLKGVDTVIHLAWYTEPEAYLQSEKNIESLTGTLKFARSAIMAGIKRFIGIGSCVEYDLTHEYLSVDTPLKPTTLYAACKVSAFKVLLQWFACYKIDFAWCRLFYLYGEGEDPRRLVSYIRNQLDSGQVARLTSGGQIRDYLDVVAASQMIADVVLSERQGAFNICSGVPISVRHLAEQIAEECGRSDLLRFNARPASSNDPARVVGIRNY